MTRRPTPVLINRGGGTAKADPAISDHVRAAFAAEGRAVDVTLEEPASIAQRCRALAASGAPLVIVGGGDGTIGSAAGALAGCDTVLGILPLGTLNHFARDLGISHKLEEAVATIARGRTRTVDLAQVNGRTFINNSAIGLYPLMVVDRDAQRKRLGRSKRLALVVASLRTLLRFHHERLSLAANDAEAVVDTPLLFVGNNDYRVDLGAAGRRTSLDDGRLCVLVLARKSRFGFIAAGVRALFNRTREADMVRLDDVKQLKVDSQRSTLKVSIDGEIEEIAPPLHYRIVPNALRVIAP